jgi:hypothetical protein
MVSAWLLALMLAGGGPDPAAADPPPDATGEEWRAEDALEDGEDEGAFLEAAAPPEGSEGGPRPARGRVRLRFDSAGGRAFQASVGARGLGGEVLLAREAGEPRAVDDAYAALAFTPAAGTRVRAGWFEPRVGAGLILGPRAAGATGSPAPRPAPAAWFGAALSGVPARAASGLRGIAVERAAGALRLGALAAWTPREARPSGGAWRPVLGTRHRDGDEEARRGALAERTLAVAAGIAPAGGRWRAWGLALATRTDPRRAPYEGSGAAAESAAAVGTGGPAGEVGAAWRAAEDTGSLEAALAWDAGGRLRLHLAATARAGPGRHAARAGLVVESEARGFVPPRALPERRPHARAGLAVERPGTLPLSLEAHAIERGPGHPLRLTLAVGLGPRRGVRLSARHEGAPRRSIVAVRLAGGRSAGGRREAGFEARFDAAGLSRRTGWAAAGTALPGGLRLDVEARLAGGRSGATWIEDGVSGRRLVRPGPAAARTRFRLGRPGRLAPTLAWARTTRAEGHSDEVRLGVHWVAGPDPGLHDDDITPPDSP